jgi:hypothetical protein
MKCPFCDHERVHKHGKSVCPDFNLSLRDRKSRGPADDSKFWMEEKPIRKRHRCRCEECKVQ